jgi:hypothetical protein
LGDVHLIAHEMHRSPHAHSGQIVLQPVEPSLHPASASAATVRIDGRAEHVDVLSDPGFGFGAQAHFCALATHFEPARDPAGQPIAALSPPIRVHFFR